MTSAEHFRSRRAPRSAVRRAVRRAATLLAAGLLVAACSQSAGTATPTAPAASDSPVASIISATPIASAMPTAGTVAPATPSSTLAPSPGPLSACVHGSVHSAPRGPKDADDGAYIEVTKVTSDRIVDLTIKSPAMGGFAAARLILPVDFCTAPPEKKWPVLMLLHSAGQSPAQYSDIDAAPDALILAPDGGTGGWYSDWWNEGKGGPPAYETFHLVELPQLIQRGWRATTRMAIAGTSMGGFGAMSYAGRHPGMFVAAASISGVLETRGWGDRVIHINLWGSPTAQAKIWSAHNPAELVSGLRGMALFISYGNGTPGPLDPPGTVADMEAGISTQNESFAAELKKLAIPVTIDAYGPGTHTKPYGDRELAKAYPILRKALTAR